MHFLWLMKLNPKSSQKKTGLLSLGALHAFCILGLVSPAFGNEEESIRLMRKSSKNVLFSTSTKMTERDVYDFVANAKISCSSGTKKIFKKENITNPVLKSKENIYLSLMEGLTTMSKLSPTMTDRLLVRMKAFPLGMSCVSAIKKAPEDLYMSILGARLIPHLKAGRDDLGDIHQPKHIVRSCGIGSLHPTSDDCQLCARTYVSETDGKLSVSANWEDKIAAKDSCSYLERTQTSFLPK